MKKITFFAFAVLVIALSTCNLEADRSVEGGQSVTADNPVVPESGQSGGATRWIEAPDTVYHLMVGSFKRVKYADSLKNKLQREGYYSDTQKYEPLNMTRVYAGAYHGLDSAEQAKASFLEKHNGAPADIWIDTVPGTKMIEIPGSEAQASVLTITANPSETPAAMSFLDRDNIWDWLKWVLLILLIIGILALLLYLIKKRNKSAASRRRRNKATEMTQPLEAGDVAGVAVEDANDDASGIFFNPWVGQFYSEGYNDKKILVLNSHPFCQYCTGEGCTKLYNCGDVSVSDNECRNTVVKAVENFLDYKRGLTGYADYMLDYERFTELIVESNDTQAFVDFWNSLVFLNYSQFATTGSEVEPSINDLSRSKGAFLEVLEKYRPDIVIIWGMTFSKRLKLKYEKREIDILDGKHASMRLFKHKGRKIPFYTIISPERISSIDDWSDYIKEAIRKA